MADFEEVLGLDVGTVRIGVARANMTAKIPEALPHIEAIKAVQSLKSIVAKYGSQAIVVGLPRDMNSNETNQTAVVRSWVVAAQQELGSIPFFWQDEAATSISAEELLGPEASKGDVDSLAACIILEDFISTPSDRRVES